MVMLSGNIIKTATVEKANDAPEGPLFSFQSERFEFGVDEDGDTVSVNILAASEISAPRVADEPRLSRNQQTMFSILHSAGARGLTTEQWNERAREAGVGTSRKADLYDLRSALHSKSLIYQSADRWVVKQ
jgi:hypothetical protein